MKKETAMEMNTETGLYCIFGKPVKHSLSPVIHNTAFAAAGINSLYLAFEPDTIGEALEAMKALSIRGASITIPFKVEAMKHVDAVDPLAEKIGSINTVINSSGTLTGHNTDGYGACDSLKNSNIEIMGSRSLVIGNGGSARSIAFTLLENGSRVIIAGRNNARVRSLRSDMEKHYPDVDSVLISGIDRAFMDDIDIIINTTPVGMSPVTGAMPIEDALLTEKHAVFDIVYSPHETALLRTARERGCRVVYGIEMLINQGIRQFELWTGKKAPAGPIRDALTARMMQRQ